MQTDTAYRLKLNLFGALAVLLLFVGFGFLMMFLHSLVSVT